VPEHEEKWLELALRLHTDDLRLQVQLSKKGQPPRNPDDRKGLPEIRLNLNATMPPDVYAKWEQVRRKLTDEAGKPMREWECLDAVCELALARKPEDAARDTGCSYTVVMRTATEEEDVTVETEDGPVPVDPVGAMLWPRPPGPKHANLDRRGHLSMLCRPASGGTDQSMAPSYSTATATAAAAAAAPTASTCTTSSPGARAARRG